MKAMTVVFSRETERRMLEETRKVTSRIFRAVGAERSEELSPPFWTWFIENPRLVNAIEVVEKFRTP